MNQTSEIPLQKGTVLDVFWVFFKLGLSAFGGPIAHLAYFRQELILKRRWLDENQFAQLLAICQFLPGPASSQLGFALGYVRAGSFGALAAFIAFTLPSALLLILFARVFPVIESHLSSALLHGLKIVAFVVVADAVLGMARKLCAERLTASIAIVSVCVVLLIDNVFSMLISIILAGIVGAIFCRSPVISVGATIYVHYGKRTGVLFFVLALVLFIVLPLFTLWWGGLWSIAEAFYHAGALVFGGGHVVLPYLQDAVVDSGWMSSETFLVGYGAAQGIPGPMFTFSAYLGALLPTGIHFLWGAAIALLCLFLPGFLLLIAVLPFWETLARSSRSINAIAGVSAAVVGLLGAILYDPIFRSAILNVNDFVIALIGFALLRVWGTNTLFVVVWCVLSSVILAYV